MELTKLEKPLPDKQVTESWLGCQQELKATLAHDIVRYGHLSGQIQHKLRRITEVDKSKPMDADTQLILGLCQEYRRLLEWMKQWERHPLSKPVTCSPLVGFTGFHSLVFSPDEKLLASRDYKERLYLWEIPSGRALHILDPGGAVTVSFSSTGDRLAIGTRAEASLWDPYKGCLIARAKPEGYTYPHFSPHLETFAYIGQRSSDVYLSDFQGNRLEKISTTAADLYSVRFDPTKPRMAILGSDSFIEIWDWKELRKEFSLKGEVTPIGQASFCDNGAHFVAEVKGDKTTKRFEVWSLTTGEKLKAFEVMAGRLLSLALYPDYCLIVNKRQLMVWSLVDQKGVWCTERCVNGEVWSAAVSPNRELLAWSKGAQIHLHHVLSGKPLLLEE
ncbi:MAG: WD40 repeat domain-containing protein [Parachlamydiales bacterium]